MSVETNPYKPDQLVATSTTFEERTVKTLFGVALYPVVYLAKLILTRTLYSTRLFGLLVVIEIILTVASPFAMVSCVVLPLGISRISQKRRIILLILGVFSWVLFWTLLGTFPELSQNL
jgi:dolichyl-phosphate-mannose--protein O-mannosyl transferase